MNLEQNDRVSEVIAGSSGVVSEGERQVGTNGLHLSDQSLLDAYSTMVRGLMDKYYADVTRYTTSGFLRMKLGAALAKRGVAPHIYESPAEAEKGMQEIEGGAKNNSLS